MAFHKTDRFNRLHQPGKAYRFYIQEGGDNKGWRRMQYNFRRKKRIRKISRLMRKGRHPRRTMRPRPR